MLLIIFWNYASKTGKTPTMALIYMSPPPQRHLEDCMWRPLSQSGFHVPVSFYSDINHASVLWGCFSEKGNIWGSPETTLLWPYTEILEFPPPPPPPYVFPTVNLRRGVSFLITIFPWIRKHSVRMLLFLFPESKVASAHHYYLFWFSIRIPLLLLKSDTFLIQK